MHNTKWSEMKIEIEENDIYIQTFILVYISNWYFSSNLYVLYYK